MSSNGNARSAGAGWPQRGLWVLAALGVGVGGYSLGHARATRARAPELVVAPRAVQDALGTLSARLGRLEQAERATLSACTALSMVSPASPANGAALAEAPAARAELAGVAPAEEPSESEEARRESERIVDTAISAGHWTEADKLNLRTSFVGLGAESRAELLQTLSRHINDGTLRIEMAGPPF